MSINKKDDNSKRQVLSLIPHLPKEIKDAVSDESLVIFVGAGASAQVKMPLWNELADETLDECFKKRFIDAGDVSFIDL